MSNTTLNSLHVVESPAPRSGKMVQNRLDWYNSPALSICGIEALQQERTSVCIEPLTGTVYREATHTRGVKSISYGRFAKSRPRGLRPVRTSGLMMDQPVGVEDSKKLSISTRRGDDDVGVDDSKKIVNTARCVHVYSETVGVQPSEKVNTENSEVWVRRCSCASRSHHHRSLHGLSLAGRAQPASASARG